MNISRRPRREARTTRGRYVFIFRRTRDVTSKLPFSENDSIRVRTRACVRVCAFCRIIGTNRTVRGGRRGVGKSRRFNSVLHSDIEKKGKKIINRINVRLNTLDSISNLRNGLFEIQTHKLIDIIPRFARIRFSHTKTCKYFARIFS